MPDCQVPSDLAEQNAELRKKLTEKHEDNARLQRQLAEEHNKLVVPDLRRSEQAQQIMDLEQKVEYWKELSLSSARYSKCGWSRDGQPLYTQEDVDNAVNFKNNVGTDYKLIVDKVNILWEDRDMVHHSEK